MSIDLFKVQIGEESTWGTAVAATALLMGVEEIELEAVNEGEVFKQVDGTLEPGDNSAILKQGAEGSLSMRASYEDIGYALDMFFSEATPTGTDPYTRVYAPPTTARATPRKATIEYGDANEAWRGVGMVANELTISGNSNEVVKVELGLIGKAVDHNASMTGSLAQRAVTEILGHHITLYMDAFGATVGTTELVNAAFNFELALKANRELKYHLGSLSPSDWRAAKYEGELTVMLELTSAIRTLLEGYLDAPGNDTPLKKQFRIAAASGTKSLDLDFAGAALEGVKLFDDEEGIEAVEIMFTAQVDTTGLGSWFAGTLVNGVATYA